MQINTWGNVNNWGSDVTRSQGSIYWGINTGWPFDCGKELFTLGWVQCGRYQPYWSEGLNNLLGGGHV